MTTRWNYEIAGIVALGVAILLAVALIVPRAHTGLVGAYTALGLHEEARKAAAVLGYNFPGSDWYADSYYLITGEDYRFDEK